MNARPVLFVVDLVLKFIRHCPVRAMKDIVTGLRKVHSGPFKMTPYIRVETYPAHLQRNYKNGLFGGLQCQSNQLFL